jgi:NAD-dependent SIR2 family protein deacetylase
LVDGTDLLLVAGTTLTTWSSFRLAKRASEAGTPVVVVNRGPTRMVLNGVPSLKLEAGVAETLTALFPL